MRGLLVTPLRACKAGFLKITTGGVEKALRQLLALTSTFPGSPIRRRGLLLSGRPLILVGTNCFEDDAHIRCLLVRKALMVVFFDMVRGLDELIVCDDSIDWSDEVAPRGSVSLDALASCQCVTIFRRGIGDALTPLRI